MSYVFFFYRLLSALSGSKHSEYKTSFCLRGTDWLLTLKQSSWSSWQIWLFQVLCRESVSGCCYWEVEWHGVVDIAVTYKRISRKGSDHECSFEYNDQSWSLYCSRSRWRFIHNRIESVLPVVSSHCRIGVCVDHSAGALSFYSIHRNMMNLIHTVQTTFTKPLYPGFGVGYKSSVKLC